MKKAKEAKKENVPMPEGQEQEAGSWKPGHLALLVSPRSCPHMPRARMYTSAADLV